MYPPNIPKSIQQFRFDRGDKIDMNEFNQIGLDIPYFVYPAFRLQDDIQEIFGGFAMWKRAKIKIQEKEEEQKVKKRRELFLRRKM